MPARTLATCLSITAALGLASAPQLARADWTGKGEVGYVMARGNSDTDTGNAKLDIAKEIGVWKHSLALSGLYGKNNDITTAQRWDIRWQSDYKLSERMFAFGAARYEDDNFSGFDYQATLSAGLGYHFINTEATKLTGTLGAGYRVLRPEQLIKDAAGNVVQRIKGERSENVVANAGIDFEQKLTATTTLTDKLLVEAGSDNTYVNNDLALRVSMTGKLALSVGYSVRHNTDPPPGIEKTDQLTTLNLVYMIK